MKMRRIKRLAAMLMCLITAIGMMSTTAFAEEALDTSKSVTLTISYAHETQAIPGAEFKLYKVADTDANTNLTLTADFAKYPVKLTNLSNDEWKTLALTLSGYAQRDQLKPVCSGKTDANGQLKFPGAASSDLKPGLYLVTGATVKVGDDRFTASPSMVFLPNSDDGKNTWNYDVTIKPKYEKEHYDTIKVLKIWDDKGYTDKRPAEITVDLLRDGKVFDTVKLTEKNSWRYTWNDLSEKYDWTVVEKEISGYTVKVEKQGATYTVTNTYVPTDPTPTNPPAKPQQAPQTGLLWWPVSILAIGGVVFLGIGMIRKKRSSDEK